MLRKVFSIILNIIAGFFFYMVCLLGFISEPTPGAKFLIVTGFSAPAVVALLAGLAVARFRNWKRTTGIVLLCASGFTTFLVFTFACLLTTDDFRKMMQPDTLKYFSDFLTGGAVIIGFAGLGLFLVRSNVVSAAKTGL